MLDQPDIVSPENSTQQPWFAHDQYLIEATAAGMMGVTGDNRKAEYEQRSLDMLRPYLIQEGDEQRAVVSIQLDPRRFHYHQGLKPTKAFPFIQAIVFTCVSMICGALSWTHFLV
jgi:hypothetical protein